MKLTAPTGFVLALLLSVVAFAQAADDIKRAAAEIDTAFTSFAQLAAPKPGSANGPLRYSDPAAKALLDQIWNWKPLVDAQPVANDLSEILRVFEVQNSVFKYYVFGAPNSDPAANSVAHQDEISRSAEALIAISGVVNASMLAFWASLPEEQRTDVRKDGIRKVRSGMVQLVNGLVQEVGNIQYSSENRLRMASALAQHGERFVASLGPGQQNELLNLARTAAAGQPDNIAAPLAAFAKVLANPPCNTFCQMN